MKSHVSMEQKCCPVCAKIFNSGAVLLDTRLRNSLERNTVTGFQLCYDCHRVVNDGFVLLVAIDETRSEQPFTPSSVWRTGQLMAVKRSKWQHIFDTEPPNTDFVFTEPAVVEKIKCLSEQSLS